MQLIEGAACAPAGRLQGLVEYLAVSERGLDGQEASSLASLTDAVIAAIRRRLEN